MEVVEESLKDIDVSLYEGFREEGGTTLLNNREGMEKKLRDMTSQRS